MLLLASVVVKLIEIFVYVNGLIIIDTDLKNIFSCIYIYIYIYIS